MTRDFLFDYKLVNGLEGDPAVYVFFPVSGRAMLFDLGTIDALSNRELLKVQNVFVSHTHIDHFIGFNRLLRVNIPHRRLVKVCGPRGFISNVQAILQGYTWNLLEEEQIRFHVTEVDDGVLRQVTLSNTNGFAAERVVEEVFKGVAVVEELEDGAVIKAALFNHGSTKSVGYHYEPPQRFHVKPDALVKEGLTAGPWIKLLQQQVARQALNETVAVGSKVYKVGELSKKIMEEVEPFSFSYLTDLVFDEGNVAVCRKLMQGSRLVICEASFRNHDRQRAFEKKHLTTKQAALIGRAVGASQLQVFHISGIYGSEFAASVQEAEQFFAAFTNQDDATIAQIISEEVYRSGA